jgi:uncharacterized membrane protein YsdA (DUF1294 family)/cold shock CspA family protein
MRLTGKLETWNDDKGFGFITTGPASARYFVHISAFRHRGRRPAAGVAVSFTAGTDPQGRKQAADVLPLKEPGKYSPASKAFIASSVFLLAVGYLYIRGSIPLVILWLYPGASAIAFILYARDKSAAQTGGQRTPEATLHNIALIGGWPGALLAQQLLRHKSKKASFLTRFWLTAALNISALLYLISAQGQWLVIEINSMTAAFARIIAPI